VVQARQASRQATQRVAAPHLDWLPLALGLSLDKGSHAAQHADGALEVQHLRARRAAKERGEVGRINLGIQG
jgi:hypothetical protein